MIAANDLERDLVDEKLQPVIGLCQQWLRFQDPRVVARRRAAISAPVQRFDDNKGGGASQLGGAYLPVLREAQFFWAAKMASSSMRVDAAFARREYREAYRVARFLAGKYRSEWLAWSRNHPVASVSLLMEDIAIEMGHRLGSDIL